MATHTSAPLASRTSTVTFSRLTPSEVKRISVARIHTAPTLDTMNNPVPSGLHDPRLGSIKSLELICATCRLPDPQCPGHCGHIELPMACYHPLYMDVTLRLLRAKCVYCHRLRLSQVKVGLACLKLRLLRYGLTEECEGVERMGSRGGGKAKRRTGVDAEDEDDDEEEDAEGLMARRETYVKRAIKRAKRREAAAVASGGGVGENGAFIRNPAAVEARRILVKQFLNDVSAQKKCAWPQCQGITPGYRKDRKVKIFKAVLSKKQSDEMKAKGMKSVNPLLFRMEEQNAFKVQEKEKPLTNGWHGGQEEEDEYEGDQTHGAEEEIAMHNALEAETQQDAAHEKEEGQPRYMTALEVQAALELLFNREQQVMRLIFYPFASSRLKVTPDMFFLTNLLVPPNKWRPVTKEDDTVTEDKQNSTLNAVIYACDEIHRIAANMRQTSHDPSVRRQTGNDHSQAGVNLQEAINNVIDVETSTRGGRVIQAGIKQNLEKKEGLFRQNMMGKRVNFAARSVISPDPNIETSEIGVPLVFAKKLTYPEPVTSHNHDAMSRAVINGMEKYPGAAAIEDERGMILSLKFKSEDQRRALAKQLLAPTIPGLKGGRGKIVHRHLQTGDVVIMNRQPTLHKPSMMAHRTRVLQKENTIRMHYANCNTYNADFDGDEMNMHFPQNEQARAESFEIADTDHQYLSSTAGKPLRGLIQDHLSMGVQFSSRDVFFDAEQYQQLLYSCLRPENHNTTGDRIQSVPPAVLKPKRLWTGKQVISTLLKNILPEGYEGLNLTSRSSTSADSWGEKTENNPDKFDVTATSIAFRDTEQVVIFKGGEHLSGILDKSQLGPSVGGLVHAIHELYGHIVAGKFLSIVSRLLTRYLNERAWSCGMEDLFLTPEGDIRRKEELKKAIALGFEVSASYVSLEASQLQARDPQLLERMEDVLRHPIQHAGLDQVYNASTKNITESVTKACLPLGLGKPFPKNQMQAMTISGAKGSNVNANLISCNLGQQVLEGRRVPVMVSGKSLPSFREYESDPVAGGYVSGRFLTGIKPQEYYFHAMSGREGLIDTAVKTSKSGYLQRCVVKGLEGMRSEYDSTVREATNGTVVQFLYGEDSLEIGKQKYLTEFSFLANNHTSVAASMNIDELWTKVRNPELDLEEKQKQILKSARKGRVVDPIMAEYPPSNHVGSTSERFTEAVAAYIKENPDKLIKDKKAGIEGVMSKKTFQRLMNIKYLRSLVDPGEAIGVVAAQSVGEPSTQMTLNTFHLAGHSTKNVTLGIPRLREIIMTASPNLSLPTMTAKLIPELTAEDGHRFAKSISRLSLAEVVDKLTITERGGSGNDTGEKVFEIIIELFPPEEYQDEYAISVEDVRKSFDYKFIPRLESVLKKEISKKDKESTLSTATASVPSIGVSVGRIADVQPRTVDEDAEAETGRDKDDEDDAESAFDEEDAKQTSAMERRADNFEEPDDDEAVVAESSDEEVDDDENEAGTGRKPKTKKKSRKMAQNLQDENPDEEMNDEESDYSDDEVEKAHLIALQKTNTHLQNFSFTRHAGAKAHITLAYPSSTPKLLLLPIVEDALRHSVIHSIPGLKSCAMFTEPVTDPRTGKPIFTPDPADPSGPSLEVKEHVVTCEGVNLLAMRDHQDIINPHTLSTNSIHHMLTYYGVEACRGTIIREIDNVFKSHGISVDNRHINLIADAMTNSGGYAAFSRHGVVRDGGSLLGRMSFETVTKFLTDAMGNGEAVDLVEGPSARIVLGRRVGVGTGSFDVVVPMA